MTTRILPSKPVLFSKFANLAVIAGSFLYFRSMLRNSPVSPDRQVLGPFKWWILLMVVIAVGNALSGLGWVTVDGGRLKHRRIIGAQSVGTDKVAQVSSEPVRRRNSRSWMPVLVMKDGSRVRLASLVCLSEGGATKMNQRIKEAMRDDDGLGFPQMDSSFGTVE